VHPSVGVASASNPHGSLRRSRPQRARRDASAAESSGRHPQRSAVLSFHPNSEKGGQKGP
jgi:hypothetical protein